VREVIVDVAATAAVVLLASATQATTGFGFALVAVPLLTIVADARTAVVATGVAGVALSVHGVLHERGHVQWRAAGLLFGSSLLGMPAGLAVLRLAPDRVLTAIVAVGVLGCTLLVWRGLRLPMNRAVLGAVGVLCGVLATATGTNGPPMVAAFQAMGYDQRKFRATITAVFAGSGVCGLVGFLIAGQLTATAVRTGLVGLPVVPLGWWLGNALFRRIDAARFRSLVLTALACSALLTAVRAATG
jgi:uncharacterized membrane protein YfcA